VILLVYVTGDCDLLTLSYWLDKSWYIKSAFNGIEVGRDGHAVTVGAQ
jgi:hypothetical protein